MAGDVGREQIEKAFELHPSDLEEVEYKDDALGRRCAIATLGSVRKAIFVHMMHNEVPLGPEDQKDRQAKVYMRRDLADNLLLRSENKRLHRQQKRDAKFEEAKLKEA
ncbi:MAG: hypothetical protein GY820_47905, partial [Gammaproteobacteria bacterium]|nr:hypothetical protein [Gammaproteobacteria bacterium]